MMKPTAIATAACVLCSAAALSSLPSTAEAPLKIGVLAYFSGPYAISGPSFRQGIEAYQATHGVSAGGRAVQMIYRDIGSDPSDAKRLVQDLIVRDGVSMVTGFYLSPDAYAAASVINETKTPALILNSASPAIVTQSPYFIRIASNIWHEVVTVADWAAKSGKKHAYIAVSDFSAGHDVQEAFRNRFLANGGQLVGEDRMPLNTVDFSAFAERIASAKPDIAMVFVPSGSSEVSFIRALSARGVLKETTVVGLSDATSTFEDSMINYYTVSHYAPSFQSDANRKFKEDLKAKFPDSAARPNFLSAAAYDGMRVLNRMLEKQKPGQAFDPTTAVDAARGFSWEGPRGAVSIDAATREFVPNEFIQRVANVDGHLQNVIVEESRAVRNPWAPPKR